MGRYTPHRAAHELAEQGIPVFPCVPNEKRPLTRNGHRDATTNHVLIQRWWRKCTDANLAMPTGQASRIIVIDLDRKNCRDGFATLAELEEDLGEPLPSTLTVCTPNRGEHLRYRVPNAVAIRSSASKILGHFNAPGFDVRGEGGYVVVPPSIVDGRCYAFKDPKVPIAELPERWVWALSTRYSPYNPGEPPTLPTTARNASRCKKWCISQLGVKGRGLVEVPHGQRNDRLYRAAFALGGLVHFGAFDPDDVRRALEWACEQWDSRTPLKDRQTIENGLRDGMTKPRAFWG